MLRLIVLTTALLFGGAAPAAALCLYKDVSGYRTTIAEEFADSTWVARARVRSGEYHPDDGGQSWSLYRLEVLETFKGAPPREIIFFTERNSGGFYLDSHGATPDVGGDYLLFLNPTPPHLRRPHEPRGAAFVNYACGQSGRWDEVSAADRAALARLARR